MNIREGLTILPRLEILLVPPWQRQEVKVMGEAWEGLYNAAVLETDWSRIEKRIEAAEAAIKERSQALSMESGTPENEAITAAINGLQALRRDVAAWKAKR